MIDINKLRLTDMKDFRLIPQLVEDMYTEYVKEQEKYICKKLFDLHIDKDILINQVQEIHRLNDVLREYADLEEQGLLLKLTPIKDFEEYYAVDMFGCIYGISKEVGNGRRILKRKTTPSKNGYEYVNLKANGIVKNKRVHRIVAEAFIPNPNNYPDVNHIDGNKLNNCVWNLEWCSKKWNSQHAFNNNLSKQLTNYKDGVWKNGKNKYALITNTVTNESKMFNSFKLATQYLGRGKDYIWQHISKGNYTFNSREYKIQVFLTKEEAEQELKRMECAE